MRLDSIIKFTEMRVHSFPIINQSALEVMTLPSNRVSVPEKVLKSLRGEHSSRGTLRLGAL